MCGRYVLVTPAAALAKEFAAFDPGLVLAPRYNIGPGQDVVVVRVDGGRRSLATLRWGLVPSWAKDPSIASKLSNARSETAASRPSFREALRRRRALVPASGFYEWKAVPAEKRKQPYYLLPSADDDLFLFAGLWERWVPKDGGQAVDTFAILTTNANELMAAMHDRMPVILQPEDARLWLDVGAGGAW